MGCDFTIVDFYKKLKVSIHAPAWGATGWPRGGVAHPWVSIHAPAWGATKSESLRRNTYLFQSTHPRGVRRMTPTASKSSKKFQSTHPRGVRPSFKLYDRQCSSFNPRTRVGCDFFRSLAFGTSGVSIHAPAWGATGVSRGFAAPIPCFNPRTRVGCDLRPLVRAFPILLFQSTHPRGVRRQFICIKRTDSGFNPRTRVGCDCIFIKCMNIRLQRYKFCETF